MKINELFEQLDVATPSAETIAKKHGVSMSTITSQLKMGIKIEAEHTTDKKVAKEIAPDLSEDLLVQLFLIEKHHQFNRDEESRYKAVKNLIEQFIDGQIGQ